MKYAPQGEWSTAIHHHDNGSTIKQLHLGQFAKNSHLKEDTSVGPHITTMDKNYILDSLLKIRKKLAHQKFLNSR